MPTALILGITGQDGSYLADILLEKGYQVHGLHRRNSQSSLGNAEHLKGKIEFHKGDLTDMKSIREAIYKSYPDFIYNMADQDSVPWSYETPGYSLDVTAGAVVKILEEVRSAEDNFSIYKHIRFFQPCSAMMFGDAPAPQTEKTLFNPLSPYAVAKTAAYYAARYYRQVHGMFVSTAILYNHDSPRRSEDYLLHKICYGAARIARGKQEKIKIGDLSQRVDIGYALDYMRTVVRIMEWEESDDFIVCSGVAREIRELVHIALTVAGVAHSNVEDFVEIDQNFVRPGKPQTLLGSYYKVCKGPGHEFHGTGYLMELIMNKANQEMEEQELLERYRNSSVL